MATPTITSTDVFKVARTQTNYTITGTNFEASQGDGKVELCTSSTYKGKIVEQSVDSWSTTSIQIDFVGGDLLDGIAYLFVTNNSAERSTGYAIEFGVSRYWGYFNPNYDKHTDCGWWKAVGGYSPDIDNMKLKSVIAYCADGHGSQIRLAVYQGGSLSNPGGATLLKDFGQTTGSATHTFLEYTTEDDLNLVKNTITWVNFKGDNSVGAFRMSRGYSKALEMDIQPDRGGASCGSGDHDPSVVYPGTMPSTTSFNNNWYSVGLRYEIENPISLTSIQENDIYHTQKNILLEGKEFGTNTGSAKVELNTASDGSGSQQDQTIVDWTDTKILFTVNRGALSYGTLYVRVRDSDSVWTSTIAVTVYSRHYIDRITIANERIKNGDSILLIGDDFSASQGGNEKVQLSNSPDGSGTTVDQTVTDWTDTQITFTTVQGALDDDDNIWVIVKRDESSLGDASPRNCEGYLIDLMSPVEFDMSLSSEFDNNDPTTRQLTEQGGQSFVAGKIVESSNPSEISLNSTNYTEVEYCLQATSDSKNSIQYELRLIDEDQQYEKLKVYNNKPKLTIVA